MGIEEENRLIKERVEKLNRLRDAGIEPYPYRFDKTAHAKDIKEKFVGFGSRFIYLERYSHEQLFFYLFQQACECSLQF